MKYAKFLDQVKQRTGLSSQEEVLLMVQATLETLGERLEKAEREKLAAQLPDPLKEILLGRQVTDRYDLEEFYNRVSARGEFGYPEAVRGSRAVMAALQEAVSKGEIGDILSELPEEYRELFGEPPASPLSPTEI